MHIILNIGKFIGIFFFFCKTNLDKKKMQDKMNFCEISKSLLFIALFCSYYVNAFIKEIDINQIDHFYTNLFGLSTEVINSQNSVISLSEMETFLFCNQINQKLKMMEKCGGIGSNNKTMSKQSAELLDIKMDEFEQMKKHFHQQQSQAAATAESKVIVRSCEFWKFYQSILKLFDRKNCPLDEEMHGTLQDQRKMINYMAIDCAEIEKELNEMGNDEVDKSTDQIVAQFVTDRKLLHYYAIASLLLMSDSGREDENNEKSVNRTIKHEWKLSEYVSETRLSDETLFSQGLRTLRTKNFTKNSEMILAIKNKIGKLIGQNLLEQLEFEQPLLMSIDLIDDEELAKKYVAMLSPDPNLSHNTEIGLAIRIFFGRILQILSKIFTNKKAISNQKQKQKFMSDLENLWHQKFVNDFRKKSTIDVVYLFWHLLVQLYNQSKLVKRAEKIVMEHSTAKSLDTMRDELLEEHTQQMIRLNSPRGGPSTENAFFEFFQNSLLDEKAAVYRLNVFYSKSEQLSSHLFKKHPKIERMCRSELSSAQIKEIEIQNYIRYFDYASDDLKWVKAEYVLNILAYYHWFLKHSKNLPKGEIEALDGYLKTAEIEIDSVPDIKSVEIVLQQQAIIFTVLNKKKDGFSRRKQIAVDKIDTFLASSHQEILNGLIQNGEFTQKLKAIYIDRERLEKMISKNSNVFNELIKASLEDEPPKDFINLEASDEAFNVAKCYEKIMSKVEIEKDELEQNKSQLTIEAAYFYYKSLRENLLSMLASLKCQDNPKFKRLIISAQVDSAKLDISMSKLSGQYEKLSKACHLKSFASSIMQNEAMLNESEKWHKLLTESNWNNSPKEELIESSNTYEINCENDEIAAEFAQQLLISPLFEQIHSFVLSHLLQKLPQFIHLINDNASELPGISIENFDKKESIELYKKIIEADTSKESLFHENILTIKLLLQAIKYREQILMLDIMENSQIMRDFEKSKAETFAFVRIIALFKNGDNETWHYVCLLIQFLNNLTARTFNPDNKWSSINHKCFGQSIDKTVNDHRKTLQYKHLELFGGYLNEVKVAEDGTDQAEDGTDQLLNILRERRGTMAKLKQLLYLNGMLKLWDNKSIRQKLLNIKFFSNQKWLLNHYNNALIATSEITKQNELIAADLFVAMNVFGEKIKDMNKIMQELMDKLWLYMRIAYDCCILQKEKHNSWSLKLRNLIPKIQIILMDKNGANCFKKLLEKMKKMTIEEEETAQIWSEQPMEKVETIKTIQKMHLKILENVTAMRKDNGLQIATELNQLTKTLNVDSEKRREFLNFLELEDLKKFFQITAVMYNKGEFLDTFVGDQNLNEIFEVGQNEGKKRKNKQKIENKLSNSDNDEESSSIKSCDVNEEDQSAAGGEDETSAFAGSEAAKDDDDDSNDFGEDNLTKNDKKSKEMINKSEDNTTEQKNKKHQHSPNKNNYQSFLSKLNTKRLDFRKIYESIIPIKGLCDDNLLYEKYKISAEKSSTEKQIVLFIGTIANEIERRVKMSKQILKLKYLNYFYDKEKAEKLVELWAIIKEVSFTVKIENLEELQNFFNKLFNTLLNILSQLDGFNYFGEMSDNGIFEIKKFQFLQQIIVRNFAFSLLDDDEHMEDWNALRNKEKMKKLFNVLGAKFDLFHFEHLKSDWKKMDEQIKIDTELFAKHFLLNDPQKDRYAMPMFAKLSQQISTNGHQFNERQSARNLESYLFNEQFEKEAMKGKDDFDFHAKQALSKLYSVIEKWSQKRARLLISGSFLLGTNSFNSDIDLICLVPAKALQKTDYFGNEQTFCEQKKCSKAAEMTSFFCQLCENESVTDLVKITYGTVLIMKFKFDQIDFDMPFVSIPNRKSLPAKINDEVLSHFVKKFNISNTEHKKMLRALSGYRSISYINNLLGITNNGEWDQILNSQDNNCQNQIIKQSKKNAKNFHVLLMALKQWAKSNYIYSNKFGYLNGITLTIMVTKIILFYPNATIPFLLEIFFFFYATRPFQVPIQLKECNFDSNSDPFFIRNPVEQQMPVFTSEFPSQNTSKMVTHSTAKIIQREFIEAFEKMRAMKKQQYFDWPAILSPSVPFIKKYEHFVAINCLAEKNVNNEKFCHFVDGRIRLQIIYNIDVEKGQKNVVEEIRLFPDVYREDCELSETLVQTSFRPNSCKMWLLGIRIGEKYENIDNLLKTFDKTIKKHYLKYNPIDVRNLNNIKNYFAILDQSEIEKEMEKLKVELKSKLVKRSELIKFD